MYFMVVLLCSVETVWCDPNFGYNSVVRRMSLQRGYLAAVGTGTTNDEQKKSNERDSVVPLC